MPVSTRATASSTNHGCHPRSSSRVNRRRKPNARASRNTNNPAQQLRAPRASPDINIRPQHRQHPRASSDVNNHCQHLENLQQLSSSEFVRSQSLPQFKYEPLPRSSTIRVLKLEPGSWDSPVRCSLSPLHLDSSSLSYEAVSYAWGSALNRREITCNGMRLAITRTLFEALRIFRHSSKPRVLWADGICIDQGNIGERSHQVRLMRLIYARASKVLIWLGHDSPEVIRAGMDLVCRIASQTVAEEKVYEEDMEIAPLVHYFWNNQAVIISPPEKSSPAGIDANSLQPLSPFFDCSWFTRLWVVQEVSQSSPAELFWGHSRTNFEWVCRAANYVLNHYYSTFSAYTAISGLNNCDAMNRIRNKQYAKQSFFNALTYTEYFNVTDPRDRVFGILGLPTCDADPETGRLFVEPDYSLSRSEVYRIVAKEILAKEKTVDLLARVQHGPSVNNNCISWVPNWNNLSTAILADSGRKTSGGMHPNIFKPKCGENDWVAIQGIVVDSLSTLISNDFESRATGVWAWLMNPSIRDVKDEFDSKTLAWTLSAGFTRNWFLVEDHTAHLAEYQAFSKKYFENTDQVNGTTHGTPSTSSTREAESASRFLEISKRVTHHRRFFKTKKGMLGLGPEAMQKGDIVTVLFGGSVPFVLRPVGLYYRLVGECYVYAIMNGQAVEEWKGSGKKATEFRIY